MENLEHSSLEPSWEGFQSRFSRLCLTGFIGAVVLLTSVAFNPADAGRYNRHRDGQRLVGGIVAGAIIGRILGGRRGARRGAFAGGIVAAIRNGERRRYRTLRRRQWRDHDWRSRDRW